MTPITWQAITSVTTDLIPKVLADAASDTTSILPNNMCITGLLLLVLKIFVYGLGAAAIIGVTIAGIQYMTARDNQAQVAAAKKRLFDVTIGIAAWAVMWAVMNWLIPGGMVDLTQGYDAVCENVALNLPEKVDPSQTDHGSAFGNGSSGGSSSSGGNSGGGNSSSSYDGVTKIKYGDKLYAFPLKWATHENILAIGEGSNAWPQNGWSHGGQTGWAMDLMLYKDTYKSYYQKGVIPWIEPVYVVAMTSGTILWRAPGSGCKQPESANETKKQGKSVCISDPYPSDCAIVEIMDDKGGIVDYIHLKADSSMPQKDAYVEAGQIIGEVGPGKCTKTANSTTSGTAPHLHIAFANVKNGPRSEFRLDLNKLRTVMDLLWDAMPVQ